MKLNFTVVALVGLSFSMFAGADQALDTAGTDFFNKCREGVIPICSQLHGGDNCCPDEASPPVQCFGFSYPAQDEEGHWYCVHESR